VAVAGCAALLRPFGARTPSGLSGWDESLRTLSAAGRFDSALALTAPDRSDAGDDLLRLEYEGLAAHYAGDLERSRAALEAAGHMAEDRYTRSLARIVLSFVSSDRTRPYRPPLTERLFLHYYGALDYLAAGERDGAAVEARRIEQELTRADPDLLEEPAVRGVAATLHAFAGTVLEASGRPEEAAVAYRLARRAGADPAVAPDPFEPAEPVGSADSARAADRAGPAAGAGAAAEPGGGPDGTAAPRSGRGTVVVALEEGWVAHRVERSLTVPLWPDEVRTLQRTARASEARGDATGDTADEVALDVARRGLGLSPLDRRSSRLRNDGDRGDPYIFRVAWPAFVGGLVPDARLRVRAGPVSGEPPLASGGEPGATGPLRADGAPVRGTAPMEPAWPAPAHPSAQGAHATADLSASVRAEFRRDAPGILARTLVRAVAKRAAVKAVKEAVSKKDEDLGEVAGLAANVATALLEQADTRGWNLLPARVRLLRLDVPAGAQRLTVLLEAAGRQRARTLDLGPVDVPAGGVVVVPTRVWDAGGRSGG